MKKIFQFILIYFIILGAIFSLYLSNDKRYQTQLSFTQSQLAGIEYLKGIYKLSISLSMYTESLESSNDKSQQSQLKKEMNQNIDNIYILQKKHPQFKDSLLHKQLLRLSNSHFHENEYYDFLEYINHENYKAGDISRLLFEEDRKTYFLASLTTHYIPEYLISLLIVHNKIEKYQYKKNLDVNSKKLYAEQMKLLYLSSKEIEGIISLLKPYPQTHKLSSIFFQIKDSLHKLKVHQQKVHITLSDEKETQTYMDLSYEILYLSYEFNDEHIRILESSLHKREKNTQENILYNKLSLLTLFLLITFLSYYFYKSYASNLKKDIEIKKINESLDKSVIYSRTDSSGNITHISTALLKISGYTKKEIIGRTHRLFRHPDMPDSIFEDLWQTILDKRTWTGELKNKRKDGTAYWVKLIISADLDENGNINGFDAYREDISDKKQLEEEKRKTQNALEFKSMFLSNMSHEIRTPLNAVLGFSQLILKTKLNTKQADLMHKIESASHLLLGVINDILDISKIESGKMQIEAASFNLKQATENIKDLLSFKAEEKGIELIVEYINITHFTILGDQLRFSQVLTNLLSNAIKFTEKGCIVIRLKGLDNDHYLCEVIDTGIGLKEEQKKNLFQNFTQADMSTSRQYGGTGLGLSISKKLVELMGGEISVQSTFGVGSTFCFVLPFTKTQEPINDAVQEDAKAIQKEINTLRGKHLLIAEDNKMNQMLVSMLLEESNLSMDFADDGQIAIEKFKDNDYDLILMDIQMPNINGYEATREIRKLNSKIPIIALSANVMEEDIKKSLDSGMDAHLAKPLELEKLNSVLLKYLKN